MVAILVLTLHGPKEICSRVYIFLLCWALIELVILPNTIATK